MIFESYSWKMELVRHNRSLKTWCKKTHTKRGYFNIERAIFHSAFVMRKLMENRKVTDRMRNKFMRCRSYKPFRPLSDRVSRFHGIFAVEKEYDLSKPDVEQLSFFDLASEIMHSYVFIPEIDKHNKMIAFFINSYRHRDDRVLLIDLARYCEAMVQIISDDVQSIRIWKDPATGRIHAKHN